MPIDLSSYETGCLYPSFLFPDLSHKSPKSHRLSWPAGINGWVKQVYFDDKTWIYLNRDTYVTFLTRYLVLKIFPGGAGTIWPASVQNEPPQNRTIGLVLMSFNLSSTLHSEGLLFESLSSMRNNSTFLEIITIVWEPLWTTKEP